MGEKYMSNDLCKKLILEYMGEDARLEILEGFDKTKSYGIMIHEALRAEYLEIVGILKKQGFHSYSVSEINGNIYGILSDDQQIVTLSHISYVDPVTIDMKTESLGDVSYILIAIDYVEECSLPIRMTNTKKITTEQITVIGTESGYVLRLADGRFVVFDGGMPCQAENIYQILQEQKAGEESPVIAAWFMSHGHEDHIGAINTFVPMYSNEIEIESFVYHFPPYKMYYGLNTKEANKANSNKHYLEAEGMYKRSCLYCELIKEYYPNSKKIIAHAGQQFQFGNIKIDVLFTSENIYKKQMYDTNMSSVCCSVTGNTGRMVMLGDSVDITCPMLNAIYENTLKCDLVQVAHHGYNGGNAEMYANLNADYAIWTNSYETVLERSLHIKEKYPRNKFDYTSVLANIIPKEGEDNIILSEETKGEEIIQRWGEML